MSNDHVIDKLLADYLEQVDDQWDVDTAVETPRALAGSGPKKRSGEYLISDLLAAYEASKKASNRE